MNPAYEIIGQLYAELYGLQKTAAQFEQALKSKDEEVALLKQRIAGLKEEVNKEKKDEDGTIPQRISNR